MRCPCGTGRDLDACCGPLLSGARAAATAEELMRSRYTAFAVRDASYVERTHDPKTAGAADFNWTERWLERSTWVGLEVLSVERGGPSDRTGLVEFRARWLEAGQGHEHHERSQFRRVGDGRWVYVGHASAEGPPAPRVGRNDPCPCGSGKKHKRCCGGR